MINDLSNYAGALRDPLTPTEVALRKNIRRNRPYLDAEIYHLLRPTGITQVELQDRVAANMDRVFYNYIEQHYPLASPDLNSFIAHTVEFLANQFANEQKFQENYAAQRYKQVMDPRGKQYLPHPEIL